MRRELDQGHEPSLSGDRVDLWLVDLRTCPERRDWLDAEELGRAARFKVAGKAAELLRSHTALRALLGSYLGRRPSEIRFEKGADGKPALGASDLAFNLSHSGRWALIGVTKAVGSGRLGVDIEEHADRPHDAIARRFFSETEVREYEALPRELRQHAFYRGWTRKEAYLKAWGTGLRFSSRRFSVALGAADGRILRSTEMPGDTPERWWFESRDLGDCHLAACWEGARDLRLERFDAAKLTAGV